MRILLTNDDGIQAVGLRALHKALVAAGHEVACVAPISEMSAVGHAVTLSMPLRVKTFKENGFRGSGVSGTPADCVKLGLSSLCEAAPDVVVSGINAGANCGVDILYSGTVSAATEGALTGIPALAVSYDNYNPDDLAAQAEWAARFVSTTDWSIVPRGCVLNLNFPACAVSESKGLRICRHTRAAYRDWYERRTDPRGREYFWLAGVIPPELLSPDTDRALLSDGHITLTPLRFDFTDYEVMDALKAAAGENDE
ncbi:Survival protein SurE-like phosphatase/nucleotidase [Desulfovibrio sp. X2]|uniref:5'/3'-nucleotidase SurE n=1 Tax=Desulfovibrio sp. X2 TaxID=941449 RepID=UPI00035885C1|nr:5'/3'-nucleotidase SurE [Desulfovibrio sp. X2]EPR44787.1 Survival protein SurE-like phosphatase/nucleotidase [Desulfovibrio sp. X2]